MQDDKMLLADEDAVRMLMDPAACTSSCLKLCDASCRRVESRGLYLCHTHQIYYPSRTSSS
jgi:hypothetical protein